MSYAASTALNLDNLDYEYEEPLRRRPLSVHTGGGLDAEARKGVSIHFVHTLQIVLLAVFVFLALGGVRVAITAQTVSLLRENAAIESDIENLNDRNDNLRVERSALASSERIVSIATTNYNMHVSSAAESLMLPDEIIAQDAPQSANDDTTGADARVVAASMD